MRNLIMVSVYVKNDCGGMIVMQDGVVLMHNTMKGHNLHKLTFKMIDKGLRFVRNQIEKDTFIDTLMIEMNDKVVCNWLKKNAVQDDYDAMYKAIKDVIQEIPIRYVLRFDKEAKAEIYADKKYLELNKEKVDNLVAEDVEDATVDDREIDTETEQIRDSLLNEFKDATADKQYLSSEMKKVSGLGI